MAVEKKAKPEIYHHDGASLTLMAIVYDPKSGEAIVERDAQGNPRMFGSTIQYIREEFTFTRVNGKPEESECIYIVDENTPRGIKDAVESAHRNKTLGVYTDKEWRAKKNMAAARAEERAEALETQNVALSQQITEVSAENEKLKKEFDDLKARFNNRR